MKKLKEIWLTYILWKDMLTNKSLWIKSEFKIPHSGMICLNSKIEKFNKEIAWNGLLTGKLKLS
jgi:hypothetical protein